MDVEQRAREMLAAEWRKRIDFGAPDSFATYMVEVIENGGMDNSPDMRAIIAALTPPEGHVVVTRNEAGQAVAVTRQDDEGRVLSVLAEFEAPEGYVLVPAEPTEAMIEASMIRVELAKRCGPGTLKVLGARAWDAMLAARPEVNND